MTQVPLPKPGCFTSSYPSAGWQEVPCVTAPAVPFMPATGTQSFTVGNGFDPTAQVSGLISAATGSFDSVAGVTSVMGPDPGQYSLQLNANTFYNTPACSGAQMPANCRGWQQFVYTYRRAQAFMQYWLLGYNSACPDGWITSSLDCFKNSPSMSVPQVPITNLGNMTLTGQVAANGQDTLIMSTGNTLYAVQNDDSVLDLVKFWKIAEFNVFGDGNLTTASFNSGSTIVVRTSVNSGVTTKPACFDRGTTGETNNLYLQPASGTPRSSTQPAIVFKESSLANWFTPCRAAVAVPAASRLADTHDLNGDGFSDIVWRDGSGNIVVWLMSGAQAELQGLAGTVPSTWSVVGQGDFNGDGSDDLLWRDTSGNTAIWFMIGTQVFSTAIVGNIAAAWSVVGVADFNGDGKGDLLWRDGSGNTAVWLMNGASVLSVGSLGNIPTTWSVAGTGDFNGDRKADILWRDTGGNASIWFMNGTTVASTAGVGNSPDNWSVVGTGDFNGDGNADIVWRDSVGDTAIWLMNGAAVSSAGGLGNIPITWSIVQTGDYNGDGTSDLLWRDNLGDTAIWFMNGTTVASTGAVGNIPPNWTVQSVNAE